LLAGLISLPLIGAYSASKHALEAISDALKMELWNTNIKVISINPGVIETSIYEILRRKINLGSLQHITNILRKAISKG